MTIARIEEAIWMKYDMSESLKQEIQAAWNRVSPNASVDTVVPPNVIKPDAPVEAQPGVGETPSLREALEAAQRGNNPAEVEANLDPELVKPDQRETVPEKPPVPSLGAAVNPYVPPQAGSQLTPSTAPGQVLPVPEAPLSGNPVAAPTRNNEFSSLLNPTPTRSPTVRDSFRGAVDSVAAGSNPPGRGVRRGPASTSVVDEGFDDITHGSAGRPPNGADPEVPLASTASVVPETEVPKAESGDAYENRRRDAIAEAQAALTDPSANLETLEAKLDRLLSYAEADVVAQAETLAPVVPGTEPLSPAAPAEGGTVRTRAVSGIAGETRFLPIPIYVGVPYSESDEETGERKRRPSVETAANGGQGGEFTPGLPPKNLKVVVKRRAPASVGEGVEGEVANGVPRAALSADLIANLRRAIAARRGVATRSLASETAVGPAGQSNGFQFGGNPRSQRTTGLLASWAGTDFNFGFGGSGLGEGIAFGLGGWLLTFWFLGRRRRAVRSVRESTDGASSAA